jgi:hypothetical protein
MEMVIGGMKRWTSNGKTIPIANPATGVAIDYHARCHGKGHGRGA